jgi:hypothetical protein
LSEHGWIVFDRYVYVYVNSDEAAAKVGQVAASGSWGAVEWAATMNGGTVQAKVDYDALGDEARGKVLALFNRLATVGRIDNREKFRQLGKKAKGKAQGFWEFKSFQDRFIGDFRSGKRFIVGAYTKKKKDNLKEEDVDRAVKALEANDKWDEQQKKKLEEQQKEKGKGT